MGFMESLRKFDEWASEPAFYLEISDDNVELKLLRQENNKLKKQLEIKEVKAIETKCKLLE